MKRAVIFIYILIFAAVASSAMRKDVKILTLGETAIRVNVYENAGGRVMFFAPHYNERISRTLAKQSIEQTGGRLIEIESSDEAGNASRFIKFTSNGKSYSIDPNRIYTANGRRCLNFPAEVEHLVEQFADQLLQIIFAPDGKILRDNESFIVAVHNNTDVDAKEASLKNKDLTAAAFVKTNFEINGAFEAQADGVYLSNTETDADNFIFLSTPRYVGYFAELGFNVVVQKASAKLPTAQCAVDDGSLSIYAAQNKIQYINLEADGKTGAFRQKQMLEAVYALLQIAPAAVVAATQSEK